MRTSFPVKSSLIVTHLSKFVRYTTSLEFSRLTIAPTNQSAIRFIWIFMPDPWVKNGEAFVRGIFLCVLNKILSVLSSVGLSETSVLWISEDTSLRKSLILLFTKWRMTLNISPALKLLIFVALDLGELIDGEADGSLMPQASCFKIDLASFV